MLSPEQSAAISGIGQSQIGRRLNRSGIDLAIEASLAAISDAGLTTKDIDGIACWPGRSPVPAVSPVDVSELKNALGLELNWYCGGNEGPGQFASIINAVMAVVSGQARHVLCHRTLVESSARSQIDNMRSAPERAKGAQAWQRPFNALAGAVTLAMYAHRYMHDFGMTREQLAQIALNGRRNAMLNPQAVMRAPMTMDDYMSARMITTPLCLYDCDVRVDASTAIIVSHIDAARDCGSPLIRFEAMSGALYGKDSWDQFDDITTMAARDAAQRMWQRTDLRPGNVDIAELYDGFSILTVFWLEALGFCGKGECGDFIAGGKRISLDGELPLNTHGGQLSAGRAHGFGFIHEAVLQLRGGAGARQVKNNPQVAVAAAGGGPLAACMLLVRDG